MTATDHKSIRTNTPAKRIKSGVRKRYARTGGKTLAPSNWLNPLAREQAGTIQKPIQARLTR